MTHHDEPDTNLDQAQRLGAELDQAIRDLQRTIAGTDIALRRARSTTHANKLKAQLETAERELRDVYRMRTGIRLRFNV